MSDSYKFFDVIADRRSIRSFSKDAVPRGTIEKILSSAILAPSGTNSQPWHFVVVEDHDLIDKMAAAVHDKMDEILSWPENENKERRINAYRRYFTFFNKAPVVIAVLGMNHQLIVRKAIESHGIKQKKNRPSAAHLSVGAAIQNLVLSVTALGYGCCWMTGPLIAADEIEELLEVEDPWYLTTIIPLGKPVEEPPSRSRKGLDRVVTWIGNNEA